MLTSHVGIKWHQKSILQGNKMLGEKGSHCCLTDVYVFITRYMVMHLSHKVLIAKEFKSGFNICWPLLCRDLHGVLFDIR